MAESCLVVRSPWNAQMWGLFDDWGVDMGWYDFSYTRESRCGGGVGLLLMMMMMICWCCVVVVHSCKIQAHSTVSFRM